MAAEVVLDASVLAKCLIAEPDSPLAWTLMAGDERRLVPEFAYAELAQVLSTAVLRGRLDSRAAHAALIEAGDLIDEACAVHPLAQRALDLAIRHRFSAYDALYIALAEARRTYVATADRRLIERARDSGLSTRVRALDDAAGREETP